LVGHPHAGEKRNTAQPNRPFDKTRPDAAGGYETHNKTENESNTEEKEDGKSHDID
jgi:hypothetical protein